jgi:hypothetical protein
MKENVYCKNCKYVLSEEERVRARANLMSSSKQRCNATRTPKEIHEFTGITTSYPEYVIPLEENKDGDCKYYEPKGGK